MLYDMLWYIDFYIIHTYIHSAVSKIFSFFLLCKHQCYPGTCYPGTHYPRTSYQFALANSHYTLCSLLPLSRDKLNFWNIWKCYPRTCYPGTCYPGTSYQLTLSNTSKACVGFYDVSQHVSHLKTHLNYLKVRNKSSQNDVLPRDIFKIKINCNLISFQDLSWEHVLSYNYVIYLQ